ncbi:sulfatase [Paenibacillus thalictri]|uniref:Arylsulfatase n=1 Tax=Paenibacillus thalictri TaxID=2527873 RepID=A0A4Q9DTY7_9BACL|nr:sulfatase [Paenibacillus thalictri]TBL80433.1 arylsulfatase [Paenibacillus thalictri]
MRMIYIDIDSLRPDHMGCYGYQRNTTPHIDSIAAEGARFNDCYCASSPCVPSRASFMSGRFGVNHGALTHWGPGCDFDYPEGDGHSEEIPFLTRYLRKAGMKTVTFSSFGDRHHAWWYFAGWNEVHSHSLKEGNEDADEVNAAVIPWLKAHGKEDNYFLHIQYWDPHTLYTYPKEYADQWNGTPVKAFPDEQTIAEHQHDSFPRSATFLHWADRFPETMPGQIGNREDFAHLLNGYDGGISYMDRHIGQLLDTLTELGIRDEVCFIISADHAESLGEHGVYMEHGNASESVHHIPLIVKIPGVTQPGQVVDGFVYNVDVIASIADLAGLPVPSGWDGASFAPALRGEHWQGRDYLVMDHALYVCQRAVRDRKWSFIRTYHEGLYDFPQVALYDMESDPYQTTNVAEQYPDVVREMDHRLMEWMQTHIYSAGSKIDPLQKVVETGPWKYMTVGEWMRRLQRDGWEDAAQDLAGKYGAESLKSAYGA